MWVRCTSLSGVLAVSTRSASEAELRSPSLEVTNAWLATLRSFPAKMELSSKQEVEENMFLKLCVCRCACACAQVFSERGAIGAWIYVS